MFMKKSERIRSLWVLFLTLPFILASCGIMGLGSTATPTPTETIQPTATLTYTATATFTPTMTFTPTYTITPHIITGPTKDPTIYCTPSGEVLCRDVSVPNLSGQVCTTTVCTDSCNNLISTENKGCQ
jgi:hypothetical protein